MLIIEGPIPPVWGHGGSYPWESHLSWVAEASALKKEVLHFSWGSEGFLGPGNISAVSCRPETGNTTPEVWVGSMRTPRTLELVLELFSSPPRHGLSCCSSDCREDWFRTPLLASLGSLWGFGFVEISALLWFLAPAETLSSFFRIRKGKEEHLQKCKNCHFEKRKPDSVSEQ